MLRSRTTSTSQGRWWMSRTTSSSKRGTSSMPLRDAASRIIFSSLRSRLYTIPTRTTLGSSEVSGLSSRASSLAPVFLDGGREGQGEGVDAADLEFGAAVGAVEDLAGEGDAGGDAA